MDALALVAVVALVSQSVIGEAPPIPRQVSSFNIAHPGFIALTRNATETKPQEQLNVIISRFNGFPFSSDYVTLVRGLGTNMATPEKATVQDLSNKLHWPNELSSIPYAALHNRSDMIMVPSGFLVPTKNKGALTIFDLSSDTPISGPFQVSNDSDKDNDWFYHRAIWMDMNGDGLLDIVTCRAQKPLIGSTKGQLLWLEQPPFSNSWWFIWQEHILVEGEGAPDTFLITAAMNTTAGPIQTIITAGYFSKSLDVWWRKNESLPWKQDNINKKVLDNTEGDAFDLIYEDISGDGKADLLVTYNKPKNGTVVAYELPTDFRVGSPTKHLIMDGLDPASGGVGKGAPGSAKLAWPTASNQTGRPDIILSGDDNGKLFMLRPKGSDTASPFTYIPYTLVDKSPGTVGEMAIGDLDADGYTDILLPCYTAGKVKILTYAPPTTGMWQKVRSWFGALLSANFLW